MAPDCENKLIQACLAALARRATTGLVVAYEEIENEYAANARLECVCDARAKCVRIGIRETSA